jgi:hypothetical protein
MAAMVSDPPVPVTDQSTDKTSAALPLAVPFVAPILPKKPVKNEEIDPEEQGGVKWTNLFQASSRFLAIEHTFRLLTEPGTREGLKGPFIRNYTRSVANLHGWADGDEFYVNYVGHPMQGGVAGFLFVQNDPGYRTAVFGKDRLYWKSRLRAAAFAWAYSTQFEIGLLSEASIGGIQAQFPQQGFVDHAITPTIGMAWMIAEDTVDRYIVEPIEARTDNRLIRLLVRSGLNPSRSFANVLNNKVPWSRTTRAGIDTYARMEPQYSTAASRRQKPAGGDETPDPLVAPFEFTLAFQPERFSGSGRPLTCLGGSGSASLRIAASWQLVTEVGGCKMVGLERNLSGDSLTYAAGPRWTTRIHGPWTAQLQLLVGGNKVTEEKMFPELKEALEAAAARDNTTPPSHGDYTQETQSNGFAVSTGGGVSYQVNRAMTIKVADLSYRHSWNSALWGRDYANSVKFTTGFVLRMGTW